MPDQNQILLQTKLHRPRVSSDLIVRPRLLERLHQGLERRLTLICAPAGFGKTTLVSSWIESNSAGSADQPSSFRAAWLSLDQNDRDLVVFLRYLIAALRTIDKGACEDTLALLFAAQKPPLEMLVISLSNELARFESGIILVLDDYYKIRGEKVSDFLTEMLNYWPPPFHLVLISRTTPPLPLARLRTNDKMIEIRSSDLRFSSEETAAFLDRAFQTPLDQATFALLDERIEGWIAGLRLATLSMHKTGSSKAVLTNLLSTDTNVADYLVEEVFSQQVPAIQTFLLRTSILESFCAPLCAAVLGEVDPAWDMQASIAWLERAGLFVTPLGENGEWYRYHQMFRDVLLHRLQETVGQGGMSELHCRAAAWFAEQGMIDEALRHSLEAGDLDLTARLMQQGLRDVLNNEDRSTLERWLRLLPEEYIQRQPWLLMIKAWVLQFSWQTNAVAKLSRQVEALLDSGFDEALQAEDLRILRGNLILFHGQEEYFRNRAASAIACCQEALAILPPSWRYVRGGAALYLGLSMRANGQGSAAESQFMAEYELLSDKTDAYALRLLFSLCFIHLHAGSLERVNQTARTMFAQAAVRNMPVIQNWARFMLGVVHFHWNELEIAEKHFSELLDHRYVAQVASVRDAFAGLAIIHQIKGEPVQASQMVDLLSQLDLEQVGGEEDRTRSLRARLLLLQGDHESAFRWADTFTEPVPDRPLLWLEIPHLTRAHILLVRNRLKDRLAALQILDGLYEIAERTYNTRYQIIVLAQLALALEADGKAAEAQAALQQAVELSRPGDFIRVFLDLGSPMQAMLAALAEQDHLSGTIRHILTAFTKEGYRYAETESAFVPGQSASSQTSKLAEPLTQRELEILRLMCEPMSLKEIAGELRISPLTVKRHSVNLYGKLGVNRRWDAVTKAISLGILPPR